MNPRIPQPEAWSENRILWATLALAASLGFTLAGLLIY